MKLSVKLFARTSRTRDEAFDKLLDNHVLPLASRRCPKDVSDILQSEAVAKLFDYYGGALRHIFTYYATEDRGTHASQAGYGSVHAQGSGLGMSHSSASPVPATRAINTMKEAMSYPGAWLAPKHAAQRTPARAP